MSRRRNWGGNAGNAGKAGYGLFAEGGLFTVYGAHFTYNGISDFFGALSHGSGTFSGDLQDNNGVVPETVSFDITDNGSITLVRASAPVAVPEPSTLAPFALAGLGMPGLLGLTLRARKRSQSA